MFNELGLHATPFNNKEMVTIMTMMTMPRFLLQPRGRCQFPTPSLTCQQRARTALSAGESRASPHLRICVRPVSSASFDLKAVVGLLPLPKAVIGLLPAWERESISMVPLPPGPSVLCSSCGKMGCWRRWQWVPLSPPSMHRAALALFGRAARTGCQSYAPVSKVPSKASSRVEEGGPRAQGACPWLLKCSP